MYKYLEENYKRHCKIFFNLANKYGRNYYEKDELVQEMFIVYLKLDKTKRYSYFGKGSKKINTENFRYVWTCLENTCKTIISKINNSSSLLSKSDRKEYNSLLTKINNKETLSKIDYDRFYYLDTLYSVSHNSSDYFNASYEPKFNLDNSVIELLDNEYDRKIIHLSFYDGLTDSEIGKELNKSRTTIRDRKKKILRDLKETLLDLGIDEDILKIHNIEGCD